MLNWLSHNCSGRPLYNWIFIIFIISSWQTKCQDLFSIIFKLDEKKKKKKNIVCFKFCLALGELTVTRLQKLPYDHIINSFTLLCIYSLTMWEEWFSNFNGILFECICGKAALCVWMIEMILRFCRTICAASFFLLKKIYGKRLIC